MSSIPSHLEPEDLWQNTAREFLAPLRLQEGRAMSLASEVRERAAKWFSEMNAGVPDVVNEWRLAFERNPGDCRDFSSYIAQNKDQELLEASSWDWRDAGSLAWNAEQIWSRSVPTTGATQSNGVEAAVFAGVGTAAQIFGRQLDHLQKEVSEALKPCFARHIGLPARWAWLNSFWISPVKTAAPKPRGFWHRLRQWIGIGADEEPAGPQFSSGSVVLDVLPQAESRQRLLWQACAEREQEGKLLTQDIAEWSREISEHAGFLSPDSPLGKRWAAVRRPLEGQMTQEEIRRRQEEVKTLIRNLGECTKRRAALATRVAEATL